MSTPRNIELTTNAPKEIHTIIDFEKRLVSSTHDVWVWISNDARVKMAKMMGENHGKNSEEKENSIKGNEAGAETRS